MTKVIDCAVCYVTDKNFLLPTLVSSFSAKRWLKPESADIFIFTLGVADETIERTREICKSQDITVTPMDPNKISGFDSAKVAKTHVPISTLGRFFFPDYLPPEYQRIVYLDGDTWAIGDISQLIDYRPPEGKLVAAEDGLYFFRKNFGSMGAKARAYLEGLQIDGERGYFNAGVLLATTSTWRQIAADAHKFFVSNTEKCLYHDQSALNAVTKHRRLRLSPKWNFASTYRHWDVERDVNPRIYHFVGGAKPWMGRCEPWSAIHDAYMSEISKFEHIGPIRRMTSEELAKYDAKERASAKKLKTVYLLRKLRYQFEIRRMLASHDTAVA
jgi:lipopolysaccharide biosynthesis glycosyltransferase